MTVCTAWSKRDWLEIFTKLLHYDDVLNYGDIWRLSFNHTQTAEITIGERKGGWKVYSHCAHGNFQCRSCRKTWLSARVVLLIRYRLKKERGTVIMRPFGQACRRCQVGEFYLPGFSREEVEHALLRLFSKIRKNCYGEEESDDGSSTSAPQGATKPHEKTLCQACRMGICCQEDD